MKQNPVTTYLSMFLYMCLALIVRVAAFAPLCFLGMEGNEGLALLCPVLLIFAVLPLKFSFAEAMADGFAIGKAFNLKRYREKLRESLLHLLSVLKWGLPMVALFVGGYFWYAEVDAITMIRSITELGGAASALWCKAYNLVGSLFGWAQKVPSANTLMEGVYVVAAIFALAVLIWVLGAVRNSATRYLWAANLPRDSRKLKGRRMAQLGAALINLLLLLPFLLIVGSVLSNIVADIAGQMMLVMMGSEPQLDLSNAGMPLLLSFVFLYLGILPLRRSLTARFALARKSEAVQS